MNDASPIGPRRPPKSRRRRPIGGEKSGDSVANEIGHATDDVPLAVTSGLRHTETIVGRRGSDETGAKERSSTGLLAGMRTKGRRSNWRPRPEHLLADSVPRGLALDRDVSPSAESELALAPAAGPAVLIDSPGGTALVQHRTSGQSTSYRTSHAQEASTAGESSDNRPRADSEASLTTSESAYDHMPPLDRALAQHFGSQPGSPVSNTHAELYADTASRRVSVATNGAIKQQNRRSKSPFETLGNMGTADGAEHRNSHRSPTTSPTRRRGRADTAASSEAGLGDDESDNDAGHHNHRNAVYGSVSRQNQRTRNDGDAPDEPEDFDEDPFEFSLRTRGLSATSSFESGALPVSSPHPIEATVPSLQEQSTLVSPPKRLYLPSIQENGVDAPDFAPFNGEMAGSFDADAMRAMQSARRRSRRRVNISGRQTVGQAEGSPISPEMRHPADARSKSDNVPRPQSADDALPSGPRSMGQATSPLNLLSPGSVVASSSVASTSPWTTSPTGPVNRPDSSIRSRRQRSHTDPALNVSTSSTPSPVTSPSRGPKSSLRRTLAMSTIQSQQISTMSSPIRAKSERGARDAEDEDGYATEPVKPVPIRSFSGSVTTAGPRTRSSSAAGDFLIPNQTSTLLQDGKDAHVKRGTNVSRSPSPRPRASKTNDPYVTFPIRRQEVPPFVAPQQSALTAMLKSAEDPDDSSASNPFNEFYGALFVTPPAAPASRFGRRNAGPDPVTVYFPSSSKPSLPVKMHVKPDLVIEEIVGCALWKYWAESRRPSLCPDSKGENDAQWDNRPAEQRALLSTSSWILKIADADEDGEIDDDFPGENVSVADNSC